MSAESVIAACAAVVALLALVVSIEQMRVMRLHNRKSVRPILRFSSGYVGDGDVVGVRLRNSGLGPAMILRSELWLDGVSLGSFSRESASRVTGELPQAKIRSATVEEGSVLEHEFAENLLSVEGFEWGRATDMAFFGLVHERLRIEITYESIYGGEGFVACFPREGVARAGSDGVPGAR